MDGYVVSTERTIPAPPEAIFDVIADASRHTQFDGSGQLRGVKPGAPERLALGTTFGMSMHLGMGYSMGNTVIEFEENRRIAWQATLAGSLGKVPGRPHLALRARAGRGGYPGARELGHLPGPPAALPPTRQGGRGHQDQHGEVAGPPGGAGRPVDLTPGPRPTERPRKIADQDGVDLVMVPLSVLDLATVAKGLHAGRGPGRHHPPGRSGRAARLPPDVGGRAPRDAGGGQLGPRRAHRPPGRRHHHPAGRGRRGHAPQPRPAGHRRAVRHPGGPPPRAHRPRPGSGPGHRPGHGPGPPARRRHRGRHLPPGRGGAHRLPGRQRRPGVPSRPRSPAGATSPRCGCSARRPSAPSWPACSACPSRFAYHFAPALLDQAVELYRAEFRPSFLLAEPYFMPAVSVLCAPTEEEARWLAGPSALSTLQLRTGRLGPGPLPRGGGRLPVHAPGAGPDRRRHRHPPDRGARHWSSRAWLELQAPHRGRRDHAVHPGPLARGPGPVAHPGGLGLALGRPGGRLDRSAV